MRVFVGFLAALAVAVVIAMFYVKPGGPPPPGNGVKLNVVASIFPLADWLREIGGADVEVHTLVSGNNNPHHFEPTIKDATRVTQAHALFIVGLGLDPWAENLAMNASTGVKLFEAGEWIKPRKMSDVKTIKLAGTSAAKHEDQEHDHDHKKSAHEEHDHDHDAHHDHDHGDADPHFWLDPARAITVVQRMAEELGKLAPAHRDAFASRAAAYIEKLKALDAEMSQAAKQIPPGTQLVTFHDAYGYLLERLGITLAAVVQTSPGVEPGTKETTEALRIMKQIGQKVVFQEPASDTAAIKVIAEELGAKIELLDPMDSELSGAGKTYLERLKHDITVLSKSGAPAQQ